MNRTSRFGPLWWTTTVWPIERPPGAPFCGVQRTPNAHRAILRRPTRAIVGPDDPTSWEARRRRRCCWPADFGSLGSRSAGIVVGDRSGGRLA